MQELTESSVSGSASGCLLIKSNRYTNNFEGIPKGKQIIFLFYVTFEFVGLYRIVKFLYTIKRIKIKGIMVDFIQKTKKSYKYYLFRQHRCTKCNSHRLETTCMNIIVQLELN